MAEYITSVRREVMRRIYFIFFASTVMKPLAIKGAFAAVFAVGVAALVSVRNVYWNSPSPAELAAFAKFVLSAFAHTDFVVQALSLSLAILALWALRDFYRAIHFLSFRRATV